MCDEWGKTHSAQCGKGLEGDDDDSLSSVFGLLGRYVLNLCISAVIMAGIGMIGSIVAEAHRVTVKALCFLVFGIVIRVRFREVGVGTIEARLGMVAIVLLEGGRTYPLRRILEKRVLMVKTENVREQSSGEIRARWSAELKVGEQTWQDDGGQAQYLLEAGDAQDERQEQQQF